MGSKKPKCLAPQQILLSPKSIDKKIIYTPELAAEILETLAGSTKGLIQLCKENPHWPDRGIINSWRIYVKDFAQMYHNAKCAQIELIVDELLQIADDSSQDTIEIEDEDGNIKQLCNREWLLRSRIRIDTRKWLASKLAPKIYGDRMTTDTTITVKHEDAIKELA